MHIPDAIHRLHLDDAARGVFDWMHRTRTALRHRAPRADREVIAFDAWSALALHAGDARLFSSQVFYLTRTHNVAATTRPEAIHEFAGSGQRAQDEIRFPADSPAAVYIDAADFDPHQRDFDDAWERVPNRVSGPAHAANAVRDHALRNARIVAVLPQDFASPTNPLSGADDLPRDVIPASPAYEVAAVTPGWVALGAVTRFAEIVDLRDRGMLDDTQVHVAAHFTLDRMLMALHLDRTGVIRTIAEVAARDNGTTRGLTWSGAGGVGLAFEMFLPTVERDTTIIDSIDQARARANLTPWGHEYARELIVSATDAAGTHFRDPAAPMVDHRPIADR